MKKLSLTSACGIVIAAFGVALPLSAAQASGNWSSHAQSDASPTIYYDDLRPMPKGAQGPIRSDMASTGGAWSSQPQSDASPTIYYDNLRPEAKGAQGPIRTDMTSTQEFFRFPLSGGG